MLCVIVDYAQIYTLTPGWKGNLMNNNERFNTLLNSCGHSRQIYNVLERLVKPCLQQTDDMSEKRKIIIGELLAFFNQAKSNQ